MPRIASFQLPRSQQRRTEHVHQPLFHLFHRWHWDLRAVPKLGMGTGSRVLMCHGGPPRCRGSHDSANDSLWLKLRPVAITLVAVSYSIGTMLLTAMAG